MQKSTIWKLGHPPMKPMWVLQDLLALWCLCTMIPPELQIQEVFLITTVNYPGSKQAQVQISSQTNKIPWNMEQSTETPKWVCREPAWVHQDLVVQTLSESSCTAKLAMETAEMLTWHSTWTNKLLVLSWVCSRPNPVPVYPQNS